MSGVSPNQGVKGDAHEQQAKAAAPKPTQQHVEAKSYANPCDYPASHEGSDLCAQWTAAVAARDSAHWQGLSYPWDVGAASAGIVTVILSLVAAIQAIRSFRSQKRTEIAQTRAYLFPHAAQLFDGMHPDIESDHEGVPHAVIVFHNSGTTPARNVRHFGELLVLPSGEEDLLQSPSTEGIPPSMCAPKADLTYKRRLCDGWDYCPTPAVIEAVRKGVFAFILNGKITYEDAYGVNRFTTYRLGYAGKWPPPDGARMIFSNTGNESD